MANAKRVYWKWKTNLSTQPHTYTEHEHEHMQAHTRVEAREANTMKQFTKLLGLMVSSSFRFIIINKMSNYINFFSLYFFLFFTQKTIRVHPNTAQF